MNNIFRKIKPILSALPIIGVFFLLSLFIAKQIIKYTPTRYLTVAKIKLDTRKYGVSNDMLYKDFDVFTSENKIETEAEILGSHLLIKRALDQVNFNNQIQRIGKLKSTMLYQNSPFSIRTEYKNNELFDHPFEVRIQDSAIYLSNENTVPKIQLEGRVNEWVEIMGNKIMLQTNDSLIEKAQIDLNGKYGVTLFSDEGLVNKIRENLQVSAVDKEMTILRVVFKDEMPRKAADFNNALCQAYIEDYVQMKSFAANKTVEFIDKKLTEVGDDLTEAEKELERFKHQNNIVNVRQETETGLRQIADLQVQLVNTMMEEKAILELEQYLDSGDFFSDKAIQVGFGDLLLTELTKKLKNLNDERRDLLIKYTENSDQVRVVDAKIEEIKFYINEAIRSNKNNIKTRRTQLEADLEKYTHQFDDIPEVERNLKILERQFKLQESVYNFLSQKRIEAFIASTSNTSFHRIIQPAIVPLKPAAPNKTLITFVSGLLGLIIGITVVCVLRFSESKVTNKADIERNSILPLSGYIRKMGIVSNKDYQTVIQSLMLRDSLKTNQIITVTSTTGDEGKAEVAQQIFKALMTKGYKTCFVEYDLSVLTNTISNSGVDIITCSPSDIGNGEIIRLKDHLNSYSKNGITVKEILEQLRLEFDFLVVNAAPVNQYIEPLEMMKISGLNLFVFKSRVSQIEWVKNINLLTEEYQIQNVHLFLTDVENDINYSGNLVDQPRVLLHWLKKLLFQLKQQKPSLQK